ncbi:kinase-like domain-containing protein [Glomus cerebriforme]|uniref:Kinase-like domain-containing protein n=1 Tax=Glomus cerebriforme TaxID=658196 RepID=A0A397TMA6_9GLOM|nr:kinase-like domain-containing protein [Glomus cerebriforme]
MTINEKIGVPKRRQTMQGQVNTSTTSKSLKSKSSISTPVSSPPSPKPKRTYTHTPKSKSLTLRASPKKDLEKSEFIFSSAQFDDKDTATTTTATTATESIASPVQSNPEESDPNSASINTSPTQSLENHESIEQAIKTLEETIKLNQHEHALRILSRQVQQPEYKDDIDNPASGRKSIRANTLPPKSLERKSILKKSYSYGGGGGGGTQSYGGAPQRPQNELQRKASIASIKPKNLCTCGDADSFWCQVCETRRFKSGFPKWTSGNRIIDSFIQETQLTTAGPFNYLEWIPFDRFRYVKNFAEGGYGTISTATWLDGPRTLRDEKMQTKWKRDPRKKVILKFLRNSENITQEFINDFAAYYKRIAWDNCMLQCYGISQDPSTKSYVIVLECAEHGNLRKYLSENVENTSWKLKLALTCDIAKALKTIHGANLIHRDFHCGNIMITNDIYTAMGDLGLCHPIVGGGKVHGVLPYLAPEVIMKQKFSKASDIYSFGFVMWEIATGIKPFNDRAHDSELAFEICMGLRPKLVDGTPGIPPNYIALMEQCWDPDPSKRPNAESLHRTLYDWARKVIETPKLPYKVNTEFAVAEQWRLRTHPHPSVSTESNPDAKYISQLFDFNDLNIPDMEETACETPHSERAQPETPRSPSVESDGNKNMIEESNQKCKSPDVELMNDTINHKTILNEKHMEIEF